MTTPKTALRRTALAERLALSADDVADRSARLTEMLFTHFDVGAWRWLHTFVPLAARREPDTWGVVRRVWAEGLPTRLAVPVVVPASHALRHYELTPTTPLRANGWGIREPLPDPAREVLPAWLDAVLVPLLAADDRGHRVGYGGGYYDRFLARCPPTTRFIGLSVLDGGPGADIADIEPTDVRLHTLITPAGVWNFG